MNKYHPHMLFAYKHTKEPVLIYDNKVFVQKTYFNNTTFNPSDLLFLTLDDPRTKQITKNELFLYHGRMTQDYIVYKEIVEQKKALLPLLRIGLIDESLPDINYFPFGRSDKHPGLHSHEIIPSGGKIEFLQWIAWLWDQKAIPYIRELLFHGKEEYYDKNNDGTYCKDYHEIKERAIITLAELGAKDVLFEYLFTQEKLENGRIKEVITGLMTAGLTDIDLSKIMKLVEKYEWLDKDACEIGWYYLERLFFKSPWLGMLRWQKMHGMRQDRDQDWLVPVQRLLCKALARIMTAKSVKMLEDIHKHTLYREMCISSLIAIKHRWALQNYMPLADPRKVHQDLIDDINRKYCDNAAYPSDYERNIIAKKPMQNAFTNNATHKKDKQITAQKKERNQQKKKILAKNAEYFKTLQAWDTIKISYKDQIANVISNDWKIIVLEAWFNNKKRIGKRSFWIHNGQSCGPAGFLDDSDKNELYFYEMCVPRIAKDQRSTIPQQTIIPIIGNPNEELDDDFLPF
jgi:hypothetical protein